MVVRTANRILIHMSKLRLYPGRVEPLIVQDLAHRVAEAVPCQSPLISKQLNHLINAFLRYRLCPIISPYKYQRIHAGNRPQRLKQLHNLFRQLNDMGPFHLHHLMRDLPETLLKVDILPTRKA